MPLPPLPPFERGHGGVTDCWNCRSRAASTTSRPWTTRRTSPTCGWRGTSWAGRAGGGSRQGEAAGGRRIAAAAPAASRCGWTCATPGPVIARAAIVTSFICWHQVAGRNATSRRWQKRDQPRWKTRRWPRRTWSCCVFTKVGGYTLEAFLPAAAMHGYDPELHSRLGFFYAVRDELGEQSLSVGPGFRSGRIRRCGACWS